MEESVKYHKINEPEIIKKIILGDAAAFETLFRSYFQLLVDFCFRFVEDVSMAENVVQEVFLKYGQTEKNLIRKQKYHFIGNVKSFMKKMK
jgi:RNA polymerase sigma-70 factor (ECF subfamily)